jgi:glyoxylase-like metal-dependent hydrolase (beta-lactamase superfamily II)
VNETVPSVTPAALDARLRAGDPFVVLDVRARDEFERWRVTAPSVETRHASHAKFVAAGVTGDVTARARDLGLDRSDRVVVACGHGAASDEVAGLLVDAGFDAANLTGGMAAWADLLVATPAPGPDDPTVVQYRRPSSGCLSHLVVSGDEAAVVDPLRAFAGRYAADAADHGADVAFAVDTHVHADHASGVTALAARTDATAVLPARATDRGLDRSVDARLLGPDETLAVGETTLAAAPLPGHTTEMTGLRLAREGASVLFCGDSVFVDAVARPDLEAGDEGAPALAARLYETLHDRIFALPDETLLLPGHYATPDAAADGLVGTSVGAARDRSLFGLDREAFVERVTGSLGARPANYERLVAVNLGRESVDEETATKLELGPNSCAAG